MKNKILVLGATGMLGRVVYHVLKKSKLYETYATVRNVNYANKDIFYLDASSFESDIEPILQKLKSVQYFINCIGVLHKKHSNEVLIRTNAIFPKKLSQYAEANNGFVINISSDAVFSAQSVGAVESSPVSPDDIYGMTKYLGEINSPNVVNFRTSIIGFDPINHNGLLEKVLQTKDITGFINQDWTGATTLQLAEFIHWVLQDKRLLQLRKKSPVYHFVPLGPITKYTIINTLAKIYPQKLIIHKGKGSTIQRTLKSQFLGGLIDDTLSQNIEVSLQKLVNYETKYLSRNMLITN